MRIRSEEVRAFAVFCRASYPHHSNGSADFVGSTYLRVFFHRASPNHHSPHSATTSDEMSVFVEEVRACLFYSSRLASPLGSTKNRGDFLGCGRLITTLRTQRRPPMRMTIRSEEVRAIAAFCRASHPHHSNGSVVFRDKRDGYLVFSNKEKRVEEKTLYLAVVRKRCG